MNERMDERYGLDTPQEREREDMELRAKYQALEKRDERMADLVHYARHYLHDENLIDDEEFAALVTDAGQSVARLEGYDKLRKENAALKQQVADGDLAFNHANEIVGKLEAQVARLSAPVSDEECDTCEGCEKPLRDDEGHETEDMVMLCDECWQGMLDDPECHSEECQCSLCIASRTTPAKPEHVCCGTFGPVEEPRHGVTNLRGPLVLRHGPDCKECQDFAERVRQTQAKHPRTTPAGAKGEQ